MRTYIYRRNGQSIAQLQFDSYSKAESYGASINADKIVIKHENNQNQKSNPA